MEQDLNDYIKTLVNKFVIGLHREGSDIEIPDELLTDIYTHYFEEKNLTEAENYVSNMLREFSGYDYERDKIDWGLTKEEMEKTPEYIKYKNLQSLNMAKWYNTDLAASYWVDVNGQKRTDDEAAKIAADKWCELCFGWHLQDNGALNENHSFMMCALGSVLGNDVKKNISESVKEKAHQNFKDYYLHYINYSKTKDHRHIEWANEKFPDNDNQDPFNWVYGFSGGSMYSDYGLTTALYLILLNSGVDEKDVRDITPWKTGIDIRTVDNTVMYRTYGNVAEL